jgi:hypothetical protein
MTAWPLEWQLSFELEYVASLIHVERYRQARAALEACRAHIDELDDSSLLAEWLWNDSRLLEREDELELSKTQLIQCLELCTQLAEPTGSWAAKTVQEAALHLNLEQIADAARHVASLPESIVDPVLRVQRFSVCVHLATVRGDNARLFHELKLFILDNLNTMDNLGWGGFALADDVVQSGCAAGHWEEVQAVLTELEELCPLQDSVAQGWLTLARYRFSQWKGELIAAEAWLKALLDNPAMRSDLRLCKSVCQLGLEHQNLGVEQAKECVVACGEEMQRKDLPHLACEATLLEAHLAVTLGSESEARKAFERSVALCDPKIRPERVVEAAMSWASFEVANGNLEHLETPMELVIRWSEPPRTDRLLGQLSYEQAVLFTEWDWDEEEKPKDGPRTVLRWCLRATDQFIEGERIEAGLNCLAHVAEWLDEQGDNELAENALQLMRQRALVTGEPEHIRRSIAAWARHLEMHNDHGLAADLMADALNTYPAHDPMALCAQHFEIASLLTRANRDSEALPHYEAALEGLRTGPLELSVKACLGLGVGYWYVDRDEDAMKLWGEALERAVSSGSRELFVEAATLIDDRLAERYDIGQDQSLELLELTVRLDQLRRWNLVESGCDLPLRYAESLARLKIDHPHVATTRQTLRELVDALLAMGQTDAAISLLQRLASIAFLQEDPETGLTVMDEVLSLLESQHGSTRKMHEMLMQAALLGNSRLSHEAWDRITEVREFLATAEDMPENEEASLDELSLWCQLHYAGLQNLRGKPEEVVAALGELVETWTLMEQQGASWDAIGKARVRLAAAQISLGMTDDAIANLSMIATRSSESLEGWFGGVILSALVGRDDIGRAIIAEVARYVEGKAYRYFSSWKLAVECLDIWLIHTRGVTVDIERAQQLADRAERARESGLATSCHLLNACYLLGAGQEERAIETVKHAYEVARRGWAMDDLGTLWFALLPEPLRSYLAEVLAADRLKQLN